MLHAVNSAKRAQAKSARYDGFEIDLNRHNGRLIVAHDEKDFSNAPTLEDIFSAIENPEQKTYWIDLKVPLTSEDIASIERIAARYKINPRKIFFETVGGETARMLTQSGFPILLPTPAGFEEDGNDSQKRALLNAQLEEMIHQYHPFAIAASIGKYPYLQAYFPHYNKAIYSSTTARPSLKKYFLAKAMFQDPKVFIFMQEEYTSLPF